MATTKLPAPKYSAMFNSRDIFPDHMYILNAEDFGTISGRLRGWFYENTARQYHQVPHLGYEQGFTEVEGVCITYTPLHYDRFTKNIPQIRISSHSRDLTDMYAKNFRDSVIPSLRREMFAKYYKQDSLTSPVILTLPGFDFINEPK